MQFYSKLFATGLDWILQYEPLFSIINNGNNPIKSDLAFLVLADLVIKQEL